MDNDFKVIMRRKPIDKLVTVRHASQVINTPIKTVKHQLEEFGVFQDSRYIISMPASHIEAKEDTNSTSPLTNPVIPPWRRK